MGVEGTMISGVSDPSTHLFREQLWQCHMSNSRETHMSEAMHVRGGSPHFSLGMGCSVGGSLSERTTVEHMMDKCGLLS